MALLCAVKDSTTPALNSDAYFVDHFDCAERDFDGACEAGGGWWSVEGRAPNGAQMLTNLAMEEARRCHKYARRYLLMAPARRYWLLSICAEMREKADGFSARLKKMVERRRPERWCALGR